MLKKFESFRVYNDTVEIEGERYKIDIINRIDKTKIDHNGTYELYNHIPLVIIENSPEENRVRIFNHVELEDINPNIPDEDTILVLDNGDECYLDEAYIILKTSNKTGMAYYDYLDDKLFHKEIKNLPKI